MAKKDWKLAGLELNSHYFAGPTMIQIYRALLLLSLLVQDSIVDTASLNRIVNGKTATEGEFPYQLSLRRNGRHICGASVLNGQWALSAAHCVDNHVDHRMYSIRAGTNKRTTGGTVMTVQEILVHPLYESVSMNFDVALLRTQSTLRGEFITPIKLPKAKQPIPLNVPAVVSGWGHMSATNDTLPEDLKYVNVYTFDQEQCAQMLHEHGEVTKAMFCASETRADACQGDSGGPINLNGVLIGVVSWGIGCADPDYPGVYTRLSYPSIRNWITVSTKL